MKYKEFNSSRVCAIDFYPLLIEAIKDTYGVCRKYNIPVVVNNKCTADVTKFFYHYCLEKFCTSFKKCPSKFPKALVVYPLPKNTPFTDQKLLKVLNVLPLPWCKCSSFDSPDMEMAVTRVIEKNKISSAKTNNFANKNLLHGFLKNFEKTKYFSSGAVDLSGDPQ
jgi:hypothetical protein